MLTDNERPWRRGQQRVTIGICLGHGLRSEILSCARSVLDDDGDAPFRRELFRNDPGYNVQQWTWRDRNDDLDRAIGKVLARGQFSCHGGETNCRAEPG